MSIVLQGSTSGSITLQEPAVAGSTVLDLPAVSGTILTTTSPKAGNVVQVVNFSTSTETNATTSTYIDTAITTSITPTSATSKILVLVSVNGLAKRDQDTTGNLRLVRGATALVVFGGAFGYTQSTANVSVAGASVGYLDSPATTSSTTYKIQVVNAGNTGSIRVNWDTLANSTITLMEIAA
jgi:hypothetical protein